MYYLYSQGRLRETKDGKDGKLGLRKEDPRMTTALVKAIRVLSSRGFLKAASLFGAMFAVTTTVVGLETGSVTTALSVAAVASPAKYLAAEIHHYVWRRIEDR